MHLGKLKLVLGDYEKVPKKFEAINLKKWPILFYAPKFNDIHGLLSIKYRISNLFVSLSKFYSLPLAFVLSMFIAGVSVKYWL